MGNDNFYLGIFEDEELVGVIDLGESHGSFSFYGKGKSGIKPIEEAEFMEFMKKYHPEAKTG